MIIEGSTLQLNSNNTPRPATLVKLTSGTATLDLNDPIAGTKHMKVYVNVNIFVHDEPVPRSSHRQRFEYDCLSDCSGCGSKFGGR